MNEETKMKWLKAFLRVYGILTLLIFGTLLGGYIIQTPTMNPGEHSTGLSGTMLLVMWDLCCS
ncbi:hypothetical protein EPA93_05020 [Ktedonosporobacter rubrisoli]|uniref:Uncharacterized protein n=1 Tax=Ktedonosporobacter rubrisoli TaxID=2509675 RepID=A0A4P6JJS3_KTERU|nr:hypothetical protein [Ktedonosporobacter rubrisoli]QBD75397.1 hypothetical protein EPA93_05020 [Ktedonosporobacter rubrisoli]